MRLGIRPRAVLWLALLGALMAAVLYPAGTHLLDRNFREFEKLQIERDSDRIRLAIRNQAVNLGVFARDYGNWDSALTFIAGTNPGFVKENIFPESLTNMGAGFAFIVNPDREVLWSGALSTQSAEALEPMPAALLKALMPAAALDHTRAALDSLSKFVWVDGECYLLAISAVTDSDVKVFGGWMVFGRRLDRQYQEGLAALTKSAFTIAPMDEQWDATAHPDDTVRIELDETGFSARQSLHSADRNSALLILTRGPRSLATQQAQAQHILLAAVLLTVLTSILLTYAILHFLVIKRVKSLSGWARGLLQSIAGLRDESTGSHDQRDEIERLRDDFSAVTHHLQRMTDRWQTEAWQDWLTKVGNRARLVHDLNALQLADASAAQSGAPQALLLIDMDNFKAVNDLMGHPCGDELLCDIARRIEALAPPQAKVYRLGGDEFAMLWSHGATRPAVDALARQLLESLRMTRFSICVSASIGIVVPDGTDESSQDLLMRADIALYSAKQAGRDQYRHYDSRDFERFKNSFDLDALLREALKQGEIELHYQPIISASSGGVHAVEALARWTHSERGAMVPSRFVAAAERSRLILEFDAFVLRTSCAALARLRRKFPSLVMSINVSPISLQGESFLDQLAELLQSGILDAAALRLELTETAVSTGLPALEHAAARLRGLGVALVIDDFGDGASSLGRLNRLQPAGLKLDGSFVRDFDGSGGRICRAVVELARELSMTVTAEFVETAAQSEFLSHIGCDFLQGFHFSHALTETALTEWMTNSQRAPAPVASH